MITHAQTSDSTYSQPRIILKSAPLQLYDGEIRMLIEKPINKNHAIEFLGSYYLNYSAFESYRFERLFSKRIGVKVGIGYRKYYTNKSYYFNPSIFYKFMNYDYTSWQVAEGWGGISYYFYGGEQNLAYRFHRHVFSFRLQMGKLFCQRRKWSGEMYTGIGGTLSYVIRKKTITDNQINEYLLKPNLQFGILLNYNIGH